MSRAVVSVDLPWSASTRGRVAIACRDRGEVTLASPDLEDRRLVPHLVQNTPVGSLLLLDIPIDGCEALDGGRPFRSVDTLLGKLGMPLLPSAKGV